MVKFPCGIYQSAVGKKHNSVCCDLCNECIHIACNNLHKKNYKLLQGSSTKWFCINCTKKELLYSGNHIIPYKVSEIETFTAKINNRISDESIFIEIINKNGQNTIVGCIYKHPRLTMGFCEYTFKPIGSTSLFEAHSSEWLLPGCGKCTRQEIKKMGLFIVVVLFIRGVIFNWGNFASCFFQSNGK